MVAPMGQYRCNGVPPDASFLLPEVPPHPAVAWPLHYWVLLPSFSFIAATLRRAFATLGWSSAGHLSVWPSSPHPGGSCHTATHLSVQSASAVGAGPPNCLEYWSGSGPAEELLFGPGVRNSASRELCQRDAANTLDLGQAMLNWRGAVVYTPSWDTWGCIGL